MINNEENWIAHQDDFNQLLAELNNCHGQDSSDKKKRNLLALRKDQNLQTLCSLYEIRKREGSSISGQNRFSLHLGEKTE